MQITTKRKANSLIIESLFKDKKTLTAMKYDNGKYEWTGKASDYIGKDVPNCSDDVKAVWVERRSNSNGVYAQVMCATYE